MYQITALSDVVEIIPHNHKDKFTSSGLIIDCQHSENICMKALNLVKEHYNIPPIHIHLHKQIPFGAGLGGGSADAITTIKLIDQILELNVTTEMMNMWAQKLGSDTSFFVNPIPAIASSKGELICPIKLDLSKYYIYVVKPTIQSSTKNAYKAVKPKSNRDPIAEILKKPIKSWRENLVNDFEYSLFKEHQQLANLKKYLYHKGALYASLSGSGTALYGIFENKVKLSTNIVAVQFPTHLK